MKQLMMTYVLNMWRRFTLYPRWVPLSFAGYIFAVLLTAFTKNVLFAYVGIIIVLIAMGLVVRKAWRESFPKRKKQ